VAERPAGQFHRLGHVPLEVEPERTAVGQIVDLALQVVGHCRVLEAKLAQQVVETGHESPLGAIGRHGHLATRKGGEDALMGLSG